MEGLENATQQQLSGSIKYVSWVMLQIPAICLIVWQLSEPKGQSY